MHHYTSRQQWVLAAFVAICHICRKYLKPDVYWYVTKQKLYITFILDLTSVHQSPTFFSSILLFPPFSSHSYLCFLIFSSVPSSFQPSPCIDIVLSICLCPPSILSAPLSLCWPGYTAKAELLSWLGEKHWLFDVFLSFLVTDCVWYCSPL